MAPIFHTKRLRTLSFLSLVTAKLPGPSSPLSAYVHLPFCAQLCSYCAFPVVVSGRSVLPQTAKTDFPSPLKSHEEYVNLLCREIRSVANRFGVNRRVASPLSTVYLGGGTPSLLHPTLLQRVVTAIRENFGLQTDAEVTCEMDPATFTLQSAEAFREIGVNRASVGAQSFNDEELASCGRIHRSADIEKAVQVLRSAGFNNLSLDLISGLPGQSLSSWHQSLDSLISLNPEHVSAYDLTLEEGTDFGKRYTAGVSPLPCESSAAQMMTVTSDVLRTAGYEHYEVSNYARRSGRRFQNTGEGSAPQEIISPFRSKHNMAYWRNEPFYGFGLGSTSVLDGFRFARPRKMSQYRRYVENLSAGVTELAEDEETKYMKWNDRMRLLYPHVEPLTERERLEDFLINSFRLLVDGVKVDELEAMFGATARKRFISAVENNRHLVDDGFLEVDEGEANARRDFRAVRLTEEGALVENAVLSTLMQAAVWRFRESNVAMV